MKLLRIAWLLAIASSAIFASCKKDKTQEEEQLPPITQTGANTFGCLINGKVYTPKGFEQNKPNFQIIVDPGFNDGNLDVRTYQKIGSNTLSLNFSSDSIKSTGVYSISNNSRLGFYFYQVNSNTAVCNVLSRFTPGATGFLKITKFNLVERVFSGEFEFHFSYPACGIGDPIHITQGRFDKKL